MIKCKSIFVIFYSPIVEWIYFQEARNAEMAPTRAKIGISSQAYIRNIHLKSIKNGERSINKNCDPIISIPPRNAKNATKEAKKAYKVP